MEKHYVVYIGVLLVIAIAILFSFDFSSSNSNVSDTKNDDQPTSSFPVPDSNNVKETIVNEEHTIEYTDTGYSPSTLTIKKGDSLTFINKASKETWPASDIHPTHKTYPGSDIKKCGSDEKSIIFDACKGLNNGESYSFTFNEIGTWNFHDHLHANDRGKIIVE